MKRIDDLDRIYDDTEHVIDLSNSEIESSFDDNESVQICEPDDTVVICPGIQQIPPNEQPVHEIDFETSKYLFLDFSSSDKDVVNYHGSDCQRKWLNSTVFFYNFYLTIKTRLSMGF